MPFTVVPREVRHARRTAPVAVLAAVAITALGFAGVLVTLARRSSGAATTPASEDATSERIVFARAPRISMPTDRAMSRAPRAAAALRERGPRADATAPVLSDPPAARDTGAAVATRPVPIAMPALPTALSPVLRGRSALRPSRDIAPAERDARAWESGFLVPSLGRMRATTATEQDSLARLATPELGERRNAHRPAPIPMGGVGVPLPGGGPTREQRFRDSLVNAKNLARLRTIEARARRATDSSAASIVP